MAQVEGGVVSALACGVCPEVQGVAGLAALEALEGVLVQIGGEAAAGAGRGAMQGTGAALLAAFGGAWVEAEQLQYGGQSHDGTQGGEIDGRACRRG